MLWMRRLGGLGGGGDCTLRTRGVGELDKIKEEYGMGLRLSSRIAPEEKGSSRSGTSSTCSASGTLWQWETGCPIWGVDGV